MIRALLFDCDGLLFNTEKISQDMWRKIAKKHHVTIPDHFFADITGAGKDSKLNQYLLDFPELADVYEEERKYRFDFNFWESFPKDTLAKNGLKELMKYLINSEYKTAVCSSSSLDYVNMLINTVSFPIHFDIKLGGENVTKGKPDPEIYVEAAHMLSVASDECLVIEDSKQGILAGYRANMRTCWIPDTISFDEDMKKYVTFQCDDLSQLITILERENYEL